MIAPLPPARAAGTNDGKVRKPSDEWRILVLRGAVTDAEQSEYWEAYHKAIAPEPQQANLPLGNQEAATSKQWLAKELLAAIRKDKANPRQGG